MYFIQQKLCCQGQNSVPMCGKREWEHKWELVNWKEDSVVFVGQSIGNTGHQLLPSRLHLRGEFLAKMRSQNNHQHVAQELLGERQNNK